MRSVQRVGGYMPIGGYGLIGDCRSAALISQDASIDWLCLPRFDHPSIFGRLLDAGGGGHWQIHPAAQYMGVSRYHDRSNVLSTVITTDGGRVVITDFMPVDEATLTEHARPHLEPRVVRIVECVTGEMTLRNDVVPAPGYGRVEPHAFRVERGRLHGDVDDLHICVRSTATLRGSRSRFRVRAGDTVAFALMAAPAGRCDELEWSVEQARRLRRQTQNFWWRWVGRLRYQGPYQEPVTRSALALKLMTYAPTGAIVAAPTTSLPEEIGGVRNWDYRFTWLRDASFTLYAFFQLGMDDEAHDFFSWLRRTGIGTGGMPVDILYTLDGTRNPEERELPHLDGYRGSRPVRIGNGAARQLQLDVYGEVLDSAYLYARFGHQVDHALWRELHGIVELAIARWEEPDRSIWEVRGPDRHFTYSKVMCWVAVDRGLRIAERFRLPHDAERWRAARRAIHRCVTEKAWSERHRAFAQTLGSDALDAAMLRLTQVRFLDDHDARVRQTVEAIARELRVGDLVRRYDTRVGHDGLPGGEGAFLACSFWLADAIAHLGDLEGAQRLFERLVTFASPLGLFSEESETTRGHLLGNYPQAFTHLSLVSAAVNIERLRHRQLAPRGLAGDELEHHHQRQGPPRARVTRSG